MWAAEQSGTLLRDQAVGIGQAGGYDERGGRPAPLHRVLCVCWHPLQTSGAGLSRPGGLGLEDPGQVPGSSVSQGET